MCNIEEVHRRINGELQVKLTQLQERIDKAIEYIDNTDNYLEISGDTLGYVTFLIDKEHRDELLTILRGEIE